MRIKYLIFIGAAAVALFISCGRSDMYEFATAFHGALYAMAHEGSTAKLIVYREGAVHVYDTAVPDIPQRIVASGQGRVLWMGAGQYYTHPDSYNSTWIPLPFPPSTISEISTVADQHGVYMLIQDSGYSVYKFDERSKVWVDNKNITTQLFSSAIFMFNSKHDGEFYIVVENIPDNYFYRYRDGSASEVLSVGSNVASVDCGERIDGVFYLGTGGSVRKLSGGVDETLSAGLMGPNYSFAIKSDSEIFAGDSDPVGPPGHVDLKKWNGSTFTSVFTLGPITGKICITDFSSDYIFFGINGMGTPDGLYRYSIKSGAAVKLLNMPVFALTVR